MLGLPNEAEQNRLIIEHSGLVDRVAARYRGRKGIPFEELLAEGMLALTVAARKWRQKAKFSTYATAYINGELKQFIDRWEVMDQLDELTDEDENRIHEWLVWGILPSEGWTELPATPQEVRDIYNSVRVRDPAALQAAMLSMSRLERKMLNSMMLCQPPMKPEQIARDNRRSYHETISILWNAAQKIADTFKRVADNKRSEFACPASQRC